MLIYPTIELQNSKPVSLYRGNLDEPQIWHVNPLEKALEFARAGIPLLVDKTVKVGALVFSLIIYFIFFPKFFIINKWRQTVT